MSNIPTKYQERTIGDMNVGDEAYTPHWAVYEAHTGHGVDTFINSHYPAGKTTHAGYVKVRRVPDGVTVTIPNEFTGSWSSRPHDYPSWGHPLPVVSIQEESSSTFARMLLA